MATPCGPKSLNGKYFAFFHFGLDRVFGERYGLLAVNMVVFYIMPTKTAYSFHGKYFSTYLDFVAFHSLLDCSTDITDTNIHSRGLR